jgi:hypothetical protein
MAAIQKQVPAFATQVRNRCRSNWYIKLVLNFRKLIYNEVSSWDSNLSARVANGTAQSECID